MFLDTSFPPVAWRHPGRLGVKDRLERNKSGKQIFIIYPGHLSFFHLGQIQTDIIWESRHIHTIFIQMYLISHCGRLPPHPNIREPPFVASLYFSQTHSSWFANRRNDQNASNRLVVVFRSRMTRGGYPIVRKWNCQLTVQLHLATIWYYCSSHNSPGSYWFDPHDSHANNFPSVKNAGSTNHRPPWHHPHDTLPLFGVKKHARHFVEFSPGKWQSFNVDGPSSQKFPGWLSGDEGWLSQAYEISCEKDGKFCRFFGVIVYTLVDLVYQKP